MYLKIAEIKKKMQYPMLNPLLLSIPGNSTEGESNVEMTDWSLVVLILSLFSLFLY